MMPEPIRRYRRAEQCEDWRLDDLAALWTDALRQHTGIPVTVTLTVEADSDEDGPYPAVRIAEITVPPAWADRLGPHAALLTDYDGYGSDAFQWGHDHLMDWAPMVPTWTADHGWMVTVIRQTTETPIVSAPEEVSSRVS